MLWEEGFSIYYDRIENIFFCGQCAGNHPEGYCLIGVSENDCSDIKRSKDYDFDNPIKCAECAESLI